MTDHFHKYRRVDIGKKKPHWVMQCSLPDCNHYFPMASKLSAPGLRGKVGICNKCEGPFVLNRRALRMAEPICNNCVVTKVKKVEADVDEFFKKMEEGLK